jgi:hypothetical protein
VVVFFPYVTVLKPSESSSTVETIGEGTADAANYFESEAVCAGPETATAAQHSSWLDAEVGPL